LKLAWSNLAREELVALRRFSIKRWGRDVTQLYLQDLRAAAKQLCVDPGRAKPLKGPYRILRVRSHYLIVHVEPEADRVTIARVLRVAMDIERHLL
jgi:plasmid stabilization system protein ParE